MLPALCFRRQVLWSDRPDGTIRGLQRWILLQRQLLHSHAQWHWWRPVPGWLLLPHWGLSANQVWPRQLLLRPWFEQHVRVVLTWLFLQWWSLHPQPHWWECHRYRLSHHCVCVCLSLSISAGLCRAWRAPCWPLSPTSHSYGHTSFWSDGHVVVCW